MQIRVHDWHNYLEKHKPKLKAAIQLMYTSMNSDSFKNAIMLHTPFKTHAGLSNDFIYRYILLGREIDSEADGEADLTLQMLHIANSDPNVVGYTSNGIVFTYSHKFEALSPAALAGHYAHEYCHLIGFADPHFDEDIPHNVPYEVGRIVEQISLGGLENIV